MKTCFCLAILLEFSSDAPEPRLGSVLARAFKKKARLGSARSLFPKARFLKFTKNEPFSHFYKRTNINIRTFFTNLS